MKKKLKNLKKLKPLLHKKNTLLFAQIAVIVLMLSIPFFIYSSQQSTQFGELASNSHAAGSTSTGSTSTGSTASNNGSSSSSAAGNTVTCPITGHQVPAGGTYPYNECTNSASWCARQFGLLRNVHVIENSQCAYTCSDNGSNCNGGTGAGKQCNPACTGAGQICDNNTGKCTTGGTTSSTGSTASNGSSSSGSTSSGSSTSSSSTATDTANIPQSNATCTLPSDPNSKVESCSVHVMGGSSPLSTNWSTEKPYDTRISKVSPESGNIQANGDTPVTFSVDCTNQTPQPVIKIDLKGGPQTITKTITMDCKGGVSVQFAIVGLANPPTNKNKNFTLTLVPSANPQASPLTFSGSGTYDPATQQYRTILPIDNIPAGKYQIKLHIDGTLDSQLIQPNGDDTFTFPALDSSKLITAIPGDIGPNKGDNFIDIIDYNKLIGCLNKPITGNCASSDINDDGKIDDSDLSLLLGQFGSLGFSFTTPQFSCSIDPNCNSGQNSIQMCSLICTKTN